MLSQCHCMWVCEYEWVSVCHCKRKRSMCKNTNVCKCLSKSICVRYRKGSCQWCNSTMGRGDIRHICFFAFLPSLLYLPNQLIEGTRELLSEQNGFHFTAPLPALDLAEWSVDCLGCQNHFGPALVCVFYCGIRKMGETVMIESYWVLWYKHVFPTVTCPLHSGQEEIP